MRIGTFSKRGDRQLLIGVAADNGSVIDLRRSAEQNGVALPFAPADVVELIAAGPAGLEAVANAVSDRKVGHYGQDEIVLHAPIPRPRKNIFCVGWNYVEHFEEGAKTRTNVKDFPAHVTFFTKATTTINGPYGAIPAHAGVTETLDWEAELAIVIGRAGINIAESEAMQYVFGYMVANDVSAREVQRRHGQQWFKGKSLDGHCPMGPWIVTSDEVPTPDALPITCRLNGVVKQSGNTQQMYFKVPRIIAELSAGLTLEPGDIILTGTPAGVGHARTPPEFMCAGDILETEIASLGILRNEVK